jgi:hypothetical protein
VKYWARIDLTAADVIQEELKEWAISSGLSTSESFWNELDVPQVYRASPQLKLSLEERGFQLMGAALIVARAKGNLIHIDDVPLNSCRINIPVMNTKGTLTAFYKCKTAPVRQPNKLTVQYDRTNVSTKLKLTSQNFYWKIEREDAKMVTAIELKGPTVLRVGAPHAVLGAKDAAPRVTITLLVTPDPGFLLDAGNRVSTEMHQAVLPS